MWFYGDVHIPRLIRFRLKHVKTNAVWHPRELAYDHPLLVNPYAFAYASMRTSMIGTHLGLRGLIAGGGLGIAAAAYLVRNASRLQFHPRFNDVKDFVGTGIKGTVGAAFAYLYMLNKGYRWSGHWEDSVASPVAGPHPDFIFASETEVCLVDAKGSSCVDTVVEGLVKHEWKRQIWPHRSTPLKLGGTCTEGAIIATVVAPGVNAAFIKGYGRLAGGGKTAATASAVRSIQRANYINACFFLGLWRTAFSMLSSELSSHPRDVLSSELKLHNPESDPRGIFLGPPRLVLEEPDRSLLVRPMAHMAVLGAFLNSLYSEAGTEEIQMPELNLTSRGGDSQGSFIIQGGDGIGAQFTPLT